ncbi:Sodium/hydrogen exchanger (fragment) [Burkholderiales bacterium]
MAKLILALLAMLLVILVASKLFTDALEHLGARLEISEGVTASVFAAVGTALPESTVPLLALLAGTADTAVNEEIRVGPILGAPLMLSTLTTFLMACSVLPRRGLHGRVRPERSGLIRDLHFFLAAFPVAAVALLVPIEARVLRLGLGMVLLLRYFVYVLGTLRASPELVAGGHATQPASRMWLARLGLPNAFWTMLPQLGASTALLLYVTKGFITGVEGVART